jgi:hypothetical protein
MLMMLTAIYGNKRNTAHESLLAGPFGLLAHWATELVTTRVRGDQNGLQERLRETRRIREEWQQKLSQEEASKADK